MTRSTAVKHKCVSSELGLKISFGGCRASLGSMADPRDVAEALGFGPWKHPKEVGKDFAAFKLQLEKLHDSRSHGSIPWLTKQFEDLEGKIMLRSRTPLPDSSPSEPLLPPDFWLAPRLADALTATKQLQKSVRKLEAQIQHIAAAFDIDLSLKLELLKMMKHLSPPPPLDVFGLALRRLEQLHL